jgi:hypothetical protein
MIILAIIIGLFLISNEGRYVTLRVTSKLLEAIAWSVKSGWAFLMGAIIVTFYTRK